MPVLCPRFTNKTTYSVSRETVYPTRMLVHICAFAYKQILAPNSKKACRFMPTRIFNFWGSFALFPQI